MTTIKAKKDLYNMGKCFTKGKTYDIDRDIRTNATLMDTIVKNDLGQPHKIGSWWREFVIIK